ncbi:hypothetical protein D9M68_186580 [compost metagenome]
MKSLPAPVRPRGCEEALRNRLMAGLPLAMKKPTDRLAGRLSDLPAGNVANPA